MASRCTLRISSSALSTADIARKLAMSPTKSYEKGEPLGADQRKTRDQSLALFESDALPNAPLQEHIAAVLKSLAHRESVLEELSRECSVDLFCMYSSVSGQGSCELDPHLLRELADRGLPLVIDLYPPSQA